jgi:biopolymer transport protein ExbD
MRARHHHDHDLFEMDEGELNLTPYLDIITTLVIFLVFTFQVVIEFRLIEVIPPAFGASAQRPKDQPEEKPVNVTLIITSVGYRLMTDRDDLYIPTELPRKPDGKYDTERLKQAAVSLKRGLNLGDSLILIAEDTTEYEVVVEAMDAIRMDGKSWLFPDVLLAKGSLGGAG